MGPPGPLPPVLLDRFQMESLSRQHSLMAWGIARWGEELEFTMSATKKEPYPDGRVRSLEGQVTGVSLCSVAVKEQS